MQSTLRARPKELHKQFPVPSRAWTVTGWMLHDNRLNQLQPTARLKDPKAGAWKI